MTVEFSTKPFQWYVFPASTAFGKVLPKSKIYEKASPSAKVKDLFVKQVDQIIWQHKLAPETMHIDATATVPEIQIFRLVLKTPDVDFQVLSCIDKATPFPLMFELCFEDRFRVVAAYKRPNLTDNSKCLISEYFCSNWQPAQQQCLPLPVVLDLAVLYKHLLAGLVYLPSRPDENTDDWILRTEQLTKLKRDISRLQNKIINEKQFNRKLEMHRELKQLEIQLKQLQQ